MDRRFQSADCYVVRAIRTFWFGSRYRILLDPAGCKRTKSKGISLRSCISNTLLRYYRLLRQDLLYRSRNCLEEQRQDPQCGTYGNQPWRKI